ncbi:MAG TPA: glycosyltransferase [Terrimicrobiaceae bacterium]|nr:glycosyltransferase [Terrimicrobiaceae bacterium]
MSLDAIGTAAGPPSHIRLSVVILSFNRAEDLCKTLAETHLAMQSLRDTAELIVVENGSTDNSLEIANHHRGVQVIPLESNIGIAGFNQGFSACRGEWILVLDDDSYPVHQCMERFLALADSIPDDVGAVACTVHHPDPAKAEAMGQWPREVISFWGCGAFLRRSVLSAVGGYREDLFLYQNELEWTIRARAAGWRVLYEPTLAVYHAGSQKNRSAAREFRHNYRNRILVACLYYDPVFLVDFLAWTATITFLKAVIKYRVSDLIFIWRPFQGNLATRAAIRSKISRPVRAWVRQRIWRDLELIPPVLTDLPRRLFLRKPIY